MKRLAIAAIFLGLIGGIGRAQENPFLRTFKQFKEVAPGIDFYASAQSDFQNYVKPVADVRAKIADFTGGELAPGAIFVCSKLAQKDAVFDQRVYRLGYKWYLIQLTADAQREERQARAQAAAAQAAQGGMDISALTGQGGGRGGQDQSGRQGRGGQDQAGQRGGQDQAGQRGANPSGQRGGGPGGAQEARQAITMAQNVGYALLTTSFPGGKPFRVSRVDDVSRTPLVDWLDIALIAYVTGTSSTNLRFLQDHIEEAFPLDDVLSMSRPFVGQQDSAGGGRGGDAGGMGSAGGVMITMGGERQGGAGGRGGGGAGGAGRVLPKDVQDRMLYDGQAATFFNYLIEKAGIDKAKEVIRQNIQGKEPFLVVQGFLGADFEKVERDWAEWLKTQK